MIVCDLCSAELEKADEQNLTLWAVFRKLGFKVTALVEGITGQAKPLRHLCQKCRFKIVEQMVQKPLTDPPQIPPPKPPKEKPVAS